MSVGVGRRFMCGKHPNIWMQLKSVLNIPLQFTGGRYVDCNVCPLCVKFARMHVKSLIETGSDHLAKYTRSRS